MFSDLTLKKCKLPISKNNIIFLIMFILAMFIKNKINKLIIKNIEVIKWIEKQKNVFAK